MYVKEYSSFYLAVLAPVFLLITIPIRILTKKHKGSFPMTIFLMPISFIVGTMMFQITFLNKMVVITTIPSMFIVGIYLPVLIFSTVYSMDHYIFMKCLPQVLPISIGIFLGISFVVGILLRDILHYDLYYEEIIISVLVCIPIQPRNVIHMLKDLSKYKYLGIMLEVETLLSLIQVTSALQLYFGFLEHILSQWYQYVLVLIRYYLLALILGYIIGKIGGKLMVYYYNVPKSVVTISISMCFLTYFLAENVLFTSGPLAVVLVSCEVKQEKHKFTLEVENCMNYFWGILSYLWDKIFFTILGVIITYYFWVCLNLTDMFGSVILYFCVNIVRFSVIGALYPLMKVIRRYHITGKCLIVLGWSDGKGIVNLMLIHLLLTTRCTSPFMQKCFTEIMMYTYLTMFINSATMKWVLSLLGMSQLSTTRKLNMDCCVQYITQKTSNNINFFKFSRYLSNADWEVVRTETVLKHPYTVKVVKEIEEHTESDDEEKEEEDADLFLYGSQVCPECIEKVPYDISEEEIKAMIKDAHIKILKAKKVSIIKQFENGIINKNCVQMLFYIFELMIESNTQSNVINLRKYFEKNKCLQAIHYIVTLLHEETIQEPPEPALRRLCFYIVMHKAYNYILWVYNVIYVIIVSIYDEPVLQPSSQIFAYHLVTTLLYSFEIIVKVLALSGNNNSINSGLDLYFKFKWNIFDFCLLLASYFDFLCIILMSLEYASGIHQFYYSFYIGELRLLKCFALFQPLYSSLLLAIEYRMDSKICLGYDLATALVNCCDEVLSLIHLSLEVKIIRNIFKKQLQLEKFELTKILEEVQNERPYIAITSKTKQTIRTAFSAMIDSLNYLKISGYVDNLEYIYIFKEIFDKQKFLMNLKYVQPTPTKHLFYDVPWMVDDVVKEYLFRHAQKVFWDKGDVVCRDGHSPLGIYVFVGGLLKLKYTPKLTTITNIKSSGMLPIVDYYGSCKFQEEWEDRITSGNSVGELSLLTERHYDCTIIADSSSQAFFLTTEMIHNAMKLSKHPVNGLEATMWKYSTINLAVAILSTAPFYQMMTKEQVKIKLQRAFMPNLRCYKMFAITDMMDDVILMEGKAVDYNYGQTLIAPMLLPRTTQKLILPNSSFTDLDDKIIVKLMVIPVGDAKEIDIMIEEEELGELAQTSTKSCLLREENYYQSKEFKMHKKYKKNQEILTKESYFSLSLFKTASKDKFEVASTISFTSSAEESEENEFQLLTQNKNINEANPSDENLQ